MTYRIYSSGKPPRPKPVVLTLTPLEAESVAVALHYSVDTTLLARLEVWGQGDAAYDTLDKKGEAAAWRALEKLRAALPSSSTAKGTP